MSGRARPVRGLRDGASILHVFEEGDCGQKAFEKLARRHSQVVVPIPKINPFTGDRWVHFQGADLVAGAYRSAANMMGEVTTFEDYGELFTTLAETLPQKSLIHHTETLVALCESNPDKFPRRAQSSSYFQQSLTAKL